ncbi:group 2 family glycosyl transferase, partial [Streptomyces sp. e14]
MLRGYVHSEILADHRIRPEAATDKVPQSILDGGPVIDTRHGQTTSLRVPDHRLVLTFDDGPDPTWTPKVLDVLKKHHAHAVFFVTGTMASRYPDLVRRMVAEGHEVGVHTFNHPDLSYQSKSRIDWELSQTQLAITGAAGVRTSLFRPPYSSFADAMDNRSWPVTRYIGSRGYITVVNTADSEDWQKPGIARIIRNATPKGGEGRGRPHARLRRRPPPDGPGPRPLSARTPGEGLPVRQPHRGARRAQRAHPGHRRRPVEGQGVDLPGPGRRRPHRRPRRLPRPGRRPGHRPVRADAAALRGARPPGAPPRLPLGRAGHRTRLGAGAGVQRGQVHREHGPFPYGERASRRGAGHRRRLGRRHGGHRRGPGPARRTGGAPAQRGQARRPQPGHRPRLARPDRDDGRRHRLRTLHRPRTRPALRRPEGRRRRRQRQGGQPRLAHRRLAAHRVRDGLQPRPPDVRRAALHADDPRRGRRVPALRPPGGRRHERGHPRRGHRHHHGDAPRRLARRLRGERPRLDRGPRVRPAAVVPALPLVLRHHAGDLEAPRRPAGPRPLRPLRPGRPAAGLPVHGGGPAARPADRHLPALRRRVRSDAEDDRGVAGRPRDPGGLRGVRLPAGPGTHDAPDLTAVAADPLPPAHVRRAAPVLDHRTDRRLGCAGQKLRRT